MNSNDVIKVVLASVLILVVAIYPILDIPIPDIVAQGFGSVVVLVLGLATDINGGSNER